MARKKTNLVSCFRGASGLFVLALIIISLAGLVVALKLLTGGNANLDAEARIRRSQPGMTLCPDQYRPVCGIDGKTYSNQCFALKAGTAVAYEGACSNPKVTPAPIRY